MRDLFRPDGGTSRLTYRQVAAWLDLLPGESAYKTAIRDALSDEQLAALAKRPREGHGPWSHAELLLAHIVDMLAWVIYAIPAAQGGKPKKPKPFPRPGVPKERKQFERQATKVLTAAQRAYLERMHHRRE